MLSKIAQILKPSPTLALAAKAKELAAQGKDVVSLTVGEPDWPTFKVAANAGIAAIEKGLTKYTAASGIPELKKAVAENTNFLLATNYTAKEVVIGAGAKFLIYAALAMVVDPGDEVLIPSPYWVSYPAMVGLVGATAKIVICSKGENFKLTAPALKASITAKTKMLILCSPSNPTGLVYSKAELHELAQVLLANPQVLILSDDIYCQLIFNGDNVAPHLLQVAPQLKDRLIIINGASKTYSMTGWRLGWALGPEKVMSILGDFISQTTSNASSIAQYAALEALKSGQPELKIALATLTRKMNWCVDQFQSLKLFKVIPPDGAFYLWVDVSGFFGKSIAGTKIQASKDVSQILLDSYFVATVPGVEFGADSYVRLSIAASDSDLQKALLRFKDFENSAI